MVNSQEINILKINSIQGDSTSGSIFEVNLEYPEELHDLHNDYLLVPKKLRLNNRCYQIIPEILLINIILRLVVLNNF